MVFSLYDVTIICIIQGDFSTTIPNFRHEKEVKCEVKVNNYRACISHRANHAVDSEKHRDTEITRGKESEKEGIDFDSSHTVLTLKTKYYTSVIPV